MILEKLLFEPQSSYLKNNRFELLEFLNFNINLHLKCILFTTVGPRPSNSIIYLPIIYLSSTYLYNYLPICIAYTHTTFIYVLYIFIYNFSLNYLNVPLNVNIIYQFLCCEYNIIGYRIIHKNLTLSKINTQQGLENFITI